MDSPLRCMISGIFEVSDLDFCVFLVIFIIGFSVLQFYIHNRLISCFRLQLMIRFGISDLLCVFLVVLESEHA